MAFDDPTHNNATKPTKPRVPKLIRFLAINLGIGVALGIAFASVLVLTNISGLNDLLQSSDQPLVPLFLLYFGCALTFGSASMGIAIMTLPYPPPPGDKQ